MAVAVAERRGLLISLVRRGRRFFGRTRLASNLTFVTFLLLLAFLTFLAIAPQLVAPLDPTKMQSVLRLRPPGFTPDDGVTRILGTDHLGRDVLSRLIYGIRPSMTVGYVGVLIAGVVGSAIGIACGYLRGLLDTVTMRIVDAQLSFPFILLALIWAAFMGGGVVSLVVIAGVRGWVEFARVARGQAASVREREFVLAARAMGASDLRILVYHIGPSCVAPLLVMATFLLGQLVLLEATLSFLGVGIQPPTPALGSMLADAEPYLSSAWWVATFPGIGIALAVLCANMLGDSMRDILDPTLRRG